MSFRQLLQRLCAPHWFRLLMAICLAAAACMLALVGPFFIQRLLLLAVRDEGMIALTLPAVLLAIAVASHAVASTANHWLLARIALDIVRDLRKYLYERVQQMPVAWFDRTPTGTIMSRLMDDVSAIQSLTSGQTLATLIDLGTALAAGVWISSRSAKLAALLGAIIPIYFLIFRLFNSQIRGATLDVRQQLDHVFARLKQKIDGMQAVRAAAAEDRESVEFTRQMAALHQPRVRAGGLAIAFSNLCVGVGGLGASLVFAVGAFDVLTGSLSVGDLITAMALAGLVFTPIARFSELAAQYQQALASFTRLAEILNAPANLPKGDRTNHTHPNILGSVAFENVCFRYAPDRPLIDRLSLAIAPGATLAVVGPTGSGKTTLLNLLLGFYEPNAGRILIDQRPLSGYSLATLRHQIGVVQQEPVVFRGTLAENICYGTPDANAETIQNAADAALLHDLAARLPRGYDTIVGEGGHPLSQGERQRIALARLFCKNPSIVILDEATSSLDRSSELLVQQALRRLLAGRTTIVIAHRLATVEAADQIIVMDQGRIVQRGQHEALLADVAGLYRQLYDSQFETARDRVAAERPAATASDKQNGPSANPVIVAAAA